MADQELLQTVARYVVLRCGRVNIVAADREYRQRFPDAKLYPTPSNAEWETAFEGLGLTNTHHCFEL